LERRASSSGSRFLDSNIFIYAYYKPRRHLGEAEQKMKNLSKNIITNISLGRESIITTVVHLSEVANILKHSFTKKELNEIIHGVFDRVDVLCWE
jgi:predicted nucleic acid-binding protein